MPHLPAWINPLQCPEVDLAPPGSATPAAERLLDYLFAPEADRSPEAFVRRYREIAAVPGSLFVAPQEQTVLEKLVWPLRHAKGSYALANYLGCIALCGMVGEMVAILLWDISKVALQGHPMSEAEQRAVFGSTFEKLGQERRTDVLHTLKLIDDCILQAFDSLRGIRRKYLHFLSQTHAQLPPDARQAYEDALKLVNFILGQTVVDGAVALRPELMNYLTEKGIVTPGDPGHGA
jgi:hypothetical protein